MLRLTTITTQRNRQWIRYRGWPRSSGSADNHGRSLWTRIMVKAVRASTLPCSLVSTVYRVHRAARLATNPRLIGCAMIIARSFARIHETNLKVRTLLRYLVRYEGYLGVYRSRECCPFGLPIRTTTAGSGPALL